MYTEKDVYKKIMYKPPLGKIRFIQRTFNFMQRDVHSDQSLFLFPSSLKHKAVKMM